MKVIQVYDKLDRHGGAQSVLITLDQHFLSKNIDIFLSGLNCYEDIFFKDTVAKNRYITFKLSNIFSFSNSIVISHSRKITTLLIVANTFLRLNCKIIHVSHSIFLSKKKFTLYPKSIIAVSNSVKQNLVEYFGINETNITVIYNGIEDLINEIEIPTYRQNNEIKVLYVGRIENVKQQIKLVQKLSGSLNKNIKIHFAGDGSEVEELERLINKNGHENFKYIGFQKNIPALATKYHYVMLFSQKEGLGLSLVEGCMAGRPLITKGINGCEACAEVCFDEYNGFIVNSYEELTNCLNQLNQIKDGRYHQLCVNSRRVYKEKFQLNRMLSAYTSYIDDLISN